MAVTSINWNDGSGDKIYVDPGSGTGNGTVQISSDPNTSTSSRSKDITFSAPGPGGISLMDTVTVTQEGRTAPPPYFWTEAIASGAFTLTIASGVTTTMLQYVSYSTDNGVTWTKTNNQDSTVVTITTPTIAAGGKVLWKGIGTKYAHGYSSNQYSTFRGSANYNVGGDIGTLFYGDNYSGTFTAMESYGLHRFFGGDTKLINAEDLVLSPLQGASRCFQSLFSGCSNLATAPTIKMTNAGYSYCFYEAFRNCSKLVVAPVLNVTTVGGNSMQNMFYGCSSMTTPPPELKATTTANSCYYGMFNGCSKLASCPDIKATTGSGTQWMREMFYGCKLITTAPVLHITTTAQNCYYRMFYNCNALNYIKMMATDISASNCLYQWVSGVAASGTFVKNSSAQWTTTGVSGIPSGWTVQTASS